MKKKLVIDKLILAFNTDEAIKEHISNFENFESETFTIIKDNCDTNYKNHYLIQLCNGEIFGYMYFGSYNYNKQHIYISVFNEQLYKNNLFVLQNIQETFNLQFNSISKLDLALDYDYNIINGFYKILKEKEINLIILNKKESNEKELKNLLHVSTGTRNNIHKYKSFYINNKEKGLTLNCYDKLKEIEDNNNTKQYIKDYLGFKKIYRIEVRVNHNILNDTLVKLGYTDDYILLCIINRINDELFEVYKNLLYRLIHLEYKKKPYSIIDIL